MEKQVKPCSQVAAGFLEKIVIRKTPISCARDLHRRGETNTRPKISQHKQVLRSGCSYSFDVMMMRIRCLIEKATVIRYFICVDQKEWNYHQDLQL